MKMRDRDYRNQTGYSQSDLRILVEKCPKAFRYHLDNPQPRSSSMMLGTAVHIALLEPDKIASEIAVTELKTRRGQAWDTFKTENLNKECILKADEWAHVLGCVDEIRQHPLWNQCLRDNPVIEKPLFWSDPFNPNIKLKSKPDIVTDTMVIDVKTTTDLSSFHRNFFNYWYHFQASAYTRAVQQEYGGEPRQYKILAVETKGINLVKAFDIDDQVIEFGSMYWEKALSILTWCLREDRYPDYGDQANGYIGLPEWAQKEMEAITQ
tara:strand:+ start:219 stop:1016 length:798 start_codon:yes stop_codon:yes gene_type:complete